VKLIRHETDTFVAEINEDGKLFKYKNKTTDYEWIHKNLRNKDKKKKAKRRKGR